MSFISLCSAEIHFVTSLTSCSPKLFHLWEEKSWLHPFPDDWQLLQLLQAWLAQKQVKTTPCCHVKSSRLLPRLYHIKLIVYQDVVEQPPRCEHERHPRAVEAVLVCAVRVSTEVGTTVFAHYEIVAPKRRVKQILPAQHCKETKVTPCRSVCVSANCLLSLSAKISRGIRKLNFESTSLLFVRDSSLHIDATFHFVSCINYIYNFILIF